MFTVLDQTQDLNGQQLHRIISTYQLPAFVKRATQDDICGSQDTLPHLFADMTRRTYPCHTAAATIISSIFFNEKRAEMNKHQAAAINARIKQAADFFKIGDFVAVLADKIIKAGEYSPALLPNSDFAVVFDTADGTKERHCPLRNVPETKAACDWLLTNRDVLTFDDKRRIADKILTKAAEFGIKLDEQMHELEKLAGMGACSGKDAAKLIRTRINVLGHMHKPNTLQMELEKLAQLCESAPRAFQHFAILTKIADMVDEFDRKHGLVQKYDDIIERPEDVLFAVTEKAAADLSNELIGNTLTGLYYKKADLENLPIRDLVDVLGQDFANEVTSSSFQLDTEKLAGIIPTLPLGDAEQFDEVVAAAGIHPFAMKAAEVGRAISAEEQQTLASMYRTMPGSLWAQI